MDEELCIKELKLANDKYFEKYFLNQDINIAISKTIMDGLKVLLIAYTRFVFLENSIQTIKRNKKFWENMNEETKITLKLVLRGVKKINKVVQNILLPISEGMEIGKET